jgi:glutamine synthetase adenylyltransferase
VSGPEDGYSPLKVPARSCNSKASKSEVLDARLGSTIVRPMGKHGGGSFELNYSSDEVDLADRLLRSRCRGRFVLEAGTGDACRGAARARLGMGKLGAGELTTSVS